MDQGLGAADAPSAPAGHLPGFAREEQEHRSLTFISNEGTLFRIAHQCFDRGFAVWRSVTSKR